VDLWTLSYVALWAVVAVQSLVLVVILRMFGSFYLGTRDGISRDGPSLGSTAPSFHARDLTGRTVNEPSPGIVNAFVFTSLGCDACRSMLPDLEALQDELAAQARLTLLVEAQLDQVAVLGEYRSTKMNVLAITNSVAHQYKVRVSPYAIVVDHNGIVRSKGLINERMHLEHLLSEARVDHPSIARHAEHVRA